MAAAKNIRNVMVHNISLFEKVIRVMSGFLVGLIIIIGLLKFFSSMLGPAIGIALNIGFYYYTKKKMGKDERLLLVAKGALASAIMSLVIGVVLWTTISALFAGVAA